ncbi:MAG TPA: hypothetical protein VNJ08_13620 [Bacteriovoracaceae bacterium]|nr:hypothetical protein [Bacteriovoracaceae bacterium]
MKPVRYKFKVTVNNHSISEVLIGRHYLEKHSSYMNDEIILQLVTALDGHVFPVDSITNGVEYFIADIELGKLEKIYRIIWLFEGKKMEILGVVNAYRKKGSKK